MDISNCILSLLQLSIHHSFNVSEICFKSVRLTTCFQVIVFSTTLYVLSSTTDIIKQGHHIVDFHILLVLAILLDNMPKNYKRPCR